jgi:hypothetical protein
MGAQNRGSGSPNPRVPGAKITLSGLNSPMLLSHSGTPDLGVGAQIRGTPESGYPGSGPWGSRTSCLGPHTVSPNKRSYYADAYHCVYHAEYVEQTILASCVCVASASGGEASESAMIYGLAATGEQAIGANGGGLILTANHRANGAGGYMD